MTTILPEGPLSIAVKVLARSLRRSPSIPPQSLLEWHLPGEGYTFDKAEALRLAQAEVAGS